MLGDVNSDVWAERDVVARFAQASTWLDPGERRSIEAAGERRPTGRVLDIGIGAGRTVELMRRFGPGYQAIDYSAEMVRACPGLLTWSPYLVGNSVL